MNAQRLAQMLLMACVLTACGQPFGACEVLNTNVDATFCFNGFTDECDADNDPEATFTKDVLCEDAGYPVECDTDIWAEDEADCV